MKITLYKKFDDIHVYSDWNLLKEKDIELVLVRVIWDLHRSKKVKSPSLLLHELLKLYGRNMENEWIIWQSYDIETWPTMIWK